MGTLKKNTEENKSHSLTCEYCGSKFKSSKPFARFCKSGCRVMYFRYKEAFDTVHEFQTKELMKKIGLKKLKDIFSEIEKASSPKYFENDGDNKVERLLDLLVTTQKGYKDKTGLMTAFNEFIKDKQTYAKKKK